MLRVGLWFDRSEFGSKIYHECFFLWMMIWIEWNVRSLQLEKVHPTSYGFSKSASIPMNV